VEALAAGRGGVSTSAADERVVERGGCLLYAAERYGLSAGSIRQGVIDV